MRVALGPAEHHPRSERKRLLRPEARVLVTPKLGWFPELQAAYLALPLGTRYAVALLFAPVLVGIFGMALELSALDFEEFLASYESMTLALASHLRELGSYREAR